MGSIYLRKYGVATTVDFCLYKLDGTGLKTDAASASGDITLYRDEAAVETLDADAFVDEGAIYSLALSLDEMTAKRIIVCIVDQSGPQVWLDKVLIIETYGHASAQHPFDLGTATVNLSSTTETQIDSIEGDTNELQTDWHDGGRLDLLVDGIITSAATAAAYSIVNSGLGFRGTVTNIPGANQFKIATLVGVGAGAFVDAMNPWFAYVFRDAGGLSGAPQGEYRQITAYNTADGQFTTAAFSAAVAVGDDIIITRNVLANVIDILADTNELQTDLHDGGRLDLLIDAIKLSTDALTLAAVADAVHDEAIEGAITHRELIRLISSALAGKLSGAGTGTLTFRDVNDGADRITATMDANNNRTGVVLNP